MEQGGGASRPAGTWPAQVGPVLWTSAPLLVALFLVLTLSVAPVSHAALARQVAAPPASGDWPTYLHDVQRSAATADEMLLAPSTAGQLTKLWSFKTGGVIAASAAVVGDTVYVGSWDGYEYALDAQTGVMKWKTFLGQTTNMQPNCQPHTAGVSSAASVQNGVVYVGGGDAYWYALDAATGSVLWKVYTGDNSAAGGYYNWASPLLYNGFAYIGLSSLCDQPLTQGQLLQVDLTSHQIVHTFNVVPTGQTGGGIWTSPTVDPASNTIVLSTGTRPLSSQQYAQAIVALDASTLAVKGVWQLPVAQQVPDSDWGTTPTLFADAAGRPLVAAINKNGYVYAFNPSNVSAGPVWQVQIAQGGPAPQYGDGSVSSGAFAQSTLYMAGGNTSINGVAFKGAVRALDPATGTFIWQHGAPDHVIAALAYANGLVIDGAGATLEVLDAATGLVLFRYATGGPIYGAPSVSHSRIFAGSVDGAVYAFGLPPAVVSATPTNTATATNRPTNTATATNTPTNTATATNTPANTATATDTPTNTAMATDTATTASLASSTATNTPPATATDTAMPTKTSTTPPTTTATDTAVPTNTATNTAMETGTAMPTKTSTTPPTSTPTAMTTLPPGTLFADDFAADPLGSSPTGWTPSGGSWAVVQDGAHVVKQTKVTSSTVELATGTAAWTDYTVAITTKAPSSLASFGITGRHRDRNNTYLLVLKGGNAWQLVKYVQGRFTQLGHGSYHYSAGQWYTFQLAFRGMGITASLNGTVLQTVTDGSLGQGGIGLRTMTTPEYGHVLVTASSSQAATRIRTTPGPALRVVPASGPPGTWVRVVGTGYGGHQRVILRWTCRPRTCRGAVALGRALTDWAGRFTDQRMTIPRTARQGTYVIEGRGTGQVVARASYTVQPVPRRGPHTPYAPAPSAFHPAPGRQPRCSILSLHRCSAIELARNPPLSR